MMLPRLSVLYGDAVKLAQQLADCGDLFWIECRYVCGIDWHANSAWMKIYKYSRTEELIYVYLPVAG